jgi:hypothetical protein
VSVRRPNASSWKDLREWEGRRSRAFEELCFQLRDPEPAGVQLRKTADPDAGFEWYWQFPDGTEHGWQCKFIDDEQTLISAMRASFDSVSRRRPKARKITFCIPRDFADDPDGARGDFGWQRFDDARADWAEAAPHIEVGLIQGGQLLERLARAEHRGRDWFWFGKQPALDENWCRGQWQVAVDSANERYRPSLNVELPIGSTLAAVALPAELRARFDSHLTRVLRACRDVLGRTRGHSPWDDARGTLRGAAQNLEDEADRPWAPQSPPAPALDAGVEALRTEAEKMYAIATVEEEVADADAKTASAAADGTGSPSGDEAASSSQQMLARHAEMRGSFARSIQHDTATLIANIDDLAESLTSPAINAARSGTLLLDGGGGTGKTHLSCDTALRLISEGHPVLLALGQWFGEASPWPTLAEQLGDPSLGWEDIVGALDAAAQATGKRAVVLIDAINESLDPRMWSKRIEELRSRLTGSRWVALAMTCRTTYLPAVQPKGGFSDGIAQITHPGFQGREFEAVERIFAAFGLQQPRVPLLLPEFTNPLFLILYCDAQSRGRLPASGAAHLTAVFEAFVASRKPDIETDLGFDPVLDPVGKAVTAFAAALTHSGNDHLPYSEAQELIDALAPASGARWPDTLFGRMLSEGLLSRDYAYLNDDTYGEAVRFPYQRFSDHLIVSALLDVHLDSDDPSASLTPGQPLHELASSSRAGLLEALAIQLPERAGVELPAVFANPCGEPTHETRHDWSRRRVLDAFVGSIASRAPSACGADVLRFADEALEHGLGDRLTGALVAVAAIPGHPLNGDWLHMMLSRFDLPDRDAFWTTMTYYSFGSSAHPLDRLVRWASRGPYPDYPPEVIELAAVPLVWLLASPNRFARDQTTKALVAMLRDRLDVATRIVERFAQIDDVYVVERLASACYGCLLRSDPATADTAQVVELLRALVTAQDAAPPNILLRDHLAGCARWARDRAGADEPELFEKALPPYASKAPKAPRKAEWLEKTYPRGTGRDDPEYSLLHSSILSEFGDFSIYTIRHATEHFLLRRLSDPPPPDPKPTPSPEETPDDPKKLQELISLLSKLQYGDPTTGTEAGGDQPTDEQMAFLREAATTPCSPGKTTKRRSEPDARYPVDRSRRFIFQRCIELGWTPERFGDFDLEVGRDDRGRSTHKAERFGKKYQWVALQELLARLADNHVLANWDGEPVAYEGAWQLSCRDLDPTLPVGQITVDAEDERHRSNPFPADPADAWWIPQGPEFDRATRDSAKWSHRTSDLPNLQSMFAKISPDGRRFVALGGHHEYKDDPGDDVSVREPDDRPRRDFGMPLVMELVRRADLDMLIDWLEAQVDPLRCLPDWNAQSHDEAHIGEMPWAASARDRRVAWQRDAFGRRTPELPVDVIAPAVGWYASGSDLDCSISDTVGLHVPSNFLASVGGLRWDGNAPVWRDAIGAPVLEHRETDQGWNRDWVLLADEDWLLDVLEREQLVLLCTAFAERRVFSPETMSHNALGWVDLGAAAVLADGAWALREWRVVWDRRSGKDPL